MAEFPALNLWTDAWLADTCHLPRVDRDIYLHLLVLMWRSPNCRVPNDMEWIGRKLACSKEDMERLPAILSEFCKSSGNWLTQKRLVKEYKLAQARSKSASDKAKSRWNKDKVSCSGNADVRGASNATTTTTTNTVEVSTPLPPKGGEGQGKGFVNGRRRQNYSIRDSFAQAAEYVETREFGRGEESGSNDPVLLPGLRESAA